MYILYSNDQILNRLDEVFNIYEDIEDFELSKADTMIKSLTKESDAHYFFERAGCIIYLIISKDSINLIMRKTGNYKVLVNKLNNYFEFIKSPK